MLNNLAEDFDIYFKIQNQTPINHGDLILIGSSFILVKFLDKTFDVITLQIITNENTNDYPFDKEKGTIKVGR